VGNFGERHQGDDPELLELNITCTVVF